MTRRDFLKAGAAIGGAGLVRIALPVFEPAKGKVLHVAVVTDVHHGLAPDAMMRMEAFVAATKAEKQVDLALQMGDFTYGGPPSDEIIRLWHGLRMPKLNVLGNHDMDKTTKDGIMKQWGMPARYGSYDHGAFRFVVLDLNHFKKAGKLNSYANGNYFADGASCNWADPEQLEWLARELRRGLKPTILISHQPLGFADKGKPLPPEQVEVLELVMAAREANPKGAVVACLSGHMHLDRFETAYGMPCLCVNSASYLWHSGMWPYRDPLYAFMEFDPAGELRVRGKQSVFVKAPPPLPGDIGVSASISDRRLPMG